ncbi:MAG: phosphatidate cytidylyltransferase [Sphaerochaeta sp.]|nr:phosphatidate cytidylyltransferase [Sphaerochaeta sp.]
MTSLGKRILTTVVAVPTLFSTIFFLPYNHYLALSFLAMITVVLASMELKTLYTKAEGIKIHLPAWTTAFLPLAQWLEIAYFPQLPLLDLTVVILSLTFFATELSVGQHDDFSKTLSRIGGASLIIIYPGLLITFIVRLISLPHTSAFLILFFLLVFGNDVFAFLFGMSFGKNNKGIIKVSPNKSLAGFIGGTLSTILLSVLFIYFVPGIKDELTIVQAVLLGLLTSISANIGDLIESAFKRSAKVKDSGNIIPGRGGLLDSIDSLLASAPVYWLLLTLF